MFRKSVSFFILLAMLWILLWLYIPDGSPNELTISDLFRSMFLLFSFMAFGFALLMLIIRYKGLELAANFIPYSWIVTWLGKHAYHYSQPKTMLFIKYTGANQSIDLTIKSANQSSTIKLTQEHTESMNLGYITENPVLTWRPLHGPLITHDLAIKDSLKKIGKNLKIHLVVNDETVISSSTS